MYFKYYAYFLGIKQSTYPEGISTTKKETVFDFLFIPLQIDQAPHHKMRLLCIRKTRIELLTRNLHIGCITVNTEILQHDIDSITRIT